MRVKVENCVALVIDIQEKLFPHMAEKELLLKNLPKLISGLKLLNIPFILNEQYPKGIGQTIPQVKNLIEDSNVFEKLTFSCCQTANTLNEIRKQNKKFVIVFGIETHVCVLQSVIDLIEEGFTPVLVTDCVSSRNNYDKKIAIKRMIQAGAIPTTLESILFELCLSSKNSVFKDISNLIK